MSATAIPWRDFVLDEYGYHRYDRQPKPDQREQDWQRQQKQARQERRRQILKSFYGAGKEVTLYEVPGFTPFAKIVTPTRTRADVTAKRITLSNAAGIRPMNDSNAMIASTLLAEAMWGRVKVRGPKEFEMKAVAYGIALGVHVTAKKQDQFTAKDVGEINDLAAKLRKRGITPEHPRRRPAHSVRLWPKATI